MAIKSFISDEEMNQLAESGKATVPSFIPDNDADKFFGKEEKPGNTITDNPLTRVSAGIIKPFGVMGENILEPVAKVLSKTTGLDIKAPRVYRDTKTNSRLFKAGEIAGEVAQFAIPGGAVTKATKGLPIIARMIAEGVTAGGVSALQQGELNKETRDVAIISSLFPGAGKIVSATKLKIGEKSAGRIINSLIKPLGRDLAYGKNPGLAVAKEGIIARSLDDLENGIQSKLDIRLKELSNQIAKSKELFNASDSLSPIDEAIQTAVKQNNPSLVTRLQKTKQALTDNLKLGKDEAGNEVIQSAGLKNLNKMSAEEIVQFKRDIGQITAFTGNPSDDKLVNSALKRVYGNVKGLIEDKIPGSKDLNERIASLISAKTATKYRAEIAERQNLIKFTPKVIGTTGLIASFMVGNPIPAFVSLGEIGIQKALETPRAKTELAKWLVKASKEQKKELFQKAPWAKGVVQSILLDDLEGTQENP